MLQNLWITEILLLVFFLVLILLLCILTDLPIVLGLSFSKKETIQAYIEKNILFKNDKEKSVCTFKLIGTNTFNNMNEVYIVMCICKYKKVDKKYVLVDECYKNGSVTMVRTFGIYRVLKLNMVEQDMPGFFPSYIANTDEYKESVRNKEKRFLKEANYIKANKRLRIKKVFKV